MLKWKYHSLENLPLEVQTQNVYGGFQVQCDDWLSFLGPPWSYSNPFFVLKVAESLQPSQVAIMEIENGDGGVTKL